MVEAELLEEVVQGDAGDTHAEGLVEEVDQVGAGGLRATQEELDKGAGVAWQELAVGAGATPTLTTRHAAYNGRPKGCPVW